MSKNDDLARKMLENMAEALSKKYQKEQEDYFSAINNVNNLEKYTKIYQKNMLKLPMFEQTKVFKMAEKMMLEQKRLCEKYNFIEESEDEDI